MAQQIAKAIACPGKVAPMRFPSFPALERTAVMGFNASIPYSIGAGDTQVFLSRSATFPIWGEQAMTGNTSTYGVGYEFTSTEGVATTELQNPTVIDTSGVWWGSNQSGVALPTRTAPGSGIKRAILGIDGATTDLPFIYAPKDSYLMMSMGKLGVNWEATITFESWVAPGDVQNYGTVFKLTSGGVDASGSATHKLTTNVWLRLKGLSLELAGTAGVGVTPVVAVGVSVSSVSAPVFSNSGSYGSWSFPAVGSSRFLLPLTFSPEYSNSIIPWQSTRLNSVAALFTNTTKVLNKEGTVLWGRVSPARYNPWRTAKTDIDQLHPAEKCFMNLEQGAYVYNPPSTDLADFHNYTYRSYYGTGNGDNDNQPVYRLDSTAYVVQGFFNDPDGDSNFAINCDYHLEFRNSSTLFQIGVASSPLECLHTAQLGLLKAGFFFNNMDHIAVISKIISALGSLHPLLSVAAPIASGILQSSSLALSKKTKTPKPTSGARSGIVLPPREGTQPSRKKRASRSKASAVRALDAMDRMMARQGKPARGGISIYRSKMRKGKR